MSVRLAAPVRRPQRAPDAEARLGGLVRLARELVGGGGSGSMLGLVVEGARQLTGAALAVLRTRDGDDLPVAAVAREDRCRAEPARVGLGEGPDGRVAASGAPLRIVDLERADPRFAIGVPSAAAGLRAYLGVPLLGSGQVVGTLAVWAPEPEWFAEDDTWLVEGLAGLATAAMEQARLAHELRAAERLATVGGVLAGMAHELTQSLAVAMGAADLLLRGPLDAGTAHRLRQIAHQAERAGTIVRAMLSLARSAPAEPEAAGDRGGRLAVGSRPGAGASVRELRGYADAPRSAHLPGNDALPPPRVRVLVVEDDAVVGDLIEEFLRMDGHEVDRAADGRQALRRARGAVYGLIVSDIRMPDVDGPTFYRELAATDPGLARRVVFVTGDALGVETRRFLDETGLGYLEKPFDFAAFRALVSRVLDRT